MIVFAREENWMVGHARSLPKRKKGTMFAFQEIVLGAALGTALSIVCAQGKSKQKPVAREPSAASGKEMFIKFCASCHGEDGRGNGPAAGALKPPPSDLTTLSRRQEGKYPAGYVSALLKFGRNLVAHGSDDMPVWGSRFKTIDPVDDPTGQQHIDDIVAYIRSLQAK
jgi:mono/diheme cytochrome c family protein